MAVTVPEQVVTETEHAVARKMLEPLPYYREALHDTGLRIVPDPSSEEVAAHRHLTGHQPDVSILVAAMDANVDCLVSFNRRHFIDDPQMALRSGLRMYTPAAAMV